MTTNENIVENLAEAKGMLNSECKKTEQAFQKSCENLHSAKKSGSRNIPELGKEKSYAFAMHVKQIASSYSDVSAIWEFSKYAYTIMISVFVNGQCVAINHTPYKLFFQFEKSKIESYVDLKKKNGTLPLKKSDVSALIDMESDMSAYYEKIRSQYAEFVIMMDEIRERYDEISE